MFKRKCPQCKNEIIYTNKKSRNRAERNQKLCKNCVYLNKKYETLLKTRKYNKRVLTDEQIEYVKKIWLNQNAVKSFVKASIEKKKKNAYINKTKKEWFRDCPQCKNQIKYTNKWNRDVAQKRKSICIHCSNKNLGKKQTGKNNPFFNKKHTKETRKKISESNKKSEKRKKFIEKTRSEEYRKKLSEAFSGEKNPAYKRGTLYNIWFKKYGEEEAKKRDIAWRKKLSQGLSGRKNFWFGKPPPKGAGNGWSGWYKNWFFRSLHELSYMINVIEKKNLLWESAEKRKYKITYIDEKGKEKNSFADFIIENKKMVEVKPTKLQNTKDVIEKKRAAKKFCKNNGLKYEMIDPPFLSSNKIKFLYESNQIIFTKKSEKKYKEKYINKK